MRAFANAAAAVPALAQTRAFLGGWRRAAVLAYDGRHGLYLALPISWGCLEATALTGMRRPLAGLGFLAMALFLERRPGPRLMAQALIFLAWSALLEMGWHPLLQSAHRGSAGGEAGATLRLQGRVLDFPTAGAASPESGAPEKISFTAATSAGRFRVQAQGVGFAVAPGQIVGIRGREKPPEAPSNPGQFDYPAYLRSQGICGVIRADSLGLIRGADAWNALVAAGREAIRHGLRRTVPESQRALLEAMLLSITADLDPEVMDDFRASGMLHILAISGQHVGLVALILLQIFSLLRLPRKAAFLATGLVLGLYVPICGGSISVVRSAVMYACALPGILWERPSSAMNNLGLAAFFCLIWMPTQILSLGFQLSFGATFFLILYSRTLSASLARLPRSGPLAGPVFQAVGYAWPTLALSAIIFLGLYPLLAGSVHTVSPVSLPGNLATVGFSSAMLVAACLALLAAAATPLGSCFGEVAGFFAAGLKASIKWLAHAPGSSLSAASLAWPWCLALLFLLAAFPYALRRGRAKLLVLCALALFAGRWAALEALDLWRLPATIAFLDVGQGDAAVIELPGAVILVDAGPPEAGRNVILPYLRSRGIQKLDLAVITHPDLDHYGGLAYVAERFPIAAVAGSGDDADTRAWGDLLAVMARRGIPRDTVLRGASLYGLRGSRSMAIQVLSPERTGQFADRNDNSVVCLLRLPGARVLMTGDLGKEAQDLLMARPEGPAGEADPPGTVSRLILKVPHHGSQRTTDPAFFDALHPDVAVISVGRKNRFGHPGPATVAHLERLGASLKTTSGDGALTYLNSSGGEAWDAFREP